jgi:hypothetical protein
MVPLLCTLLEYASMLYLSAGTLHAPSPLLTRKRQKSEGELTPPGRRTAIEQMATGELVAARESLFAVDTGWCAAAPYSECISWVAAEMKAVGCCSLQGQPSSPDTSSRMSGNMTAEVTDYPVELVRG